MRKATEKELDLKNKSGNGSRYIFLSIGIIILLLGSILVATLLGSADLSVNTVFDVL